MKRLLGVTLAGLVAVAAVQAHALYVVTDGEKVTVVFSDELKPDPRVKEDSWKKVDGLKLTARDAAGKATEVNTTRGEACLTCTVPAGTQIIHGQAAYGVSKHGDKPRLLTFHLKAAMNGASDKAATIGEGCPLEVVPVAADGKVKFRVLAAGKPVPKVEVSVMVPGQGEKAKESTDADGYTPAFDAKGKYGVTVRKTEPKSGEAGGEKYEETMAVATLVTELK
jgi:uncharacterized GH25 family protein